MKKTLILLVGLVFLTSCEKMKNASEKTIKGYIGGCFEVSLYSGGKKVYTDYANYVNTEEKSDGFYFKNIQGKFVRLSGNVLIKEVEEELCKKK